jgi:hypothetical protein
VRTALEYEAAVMTIVLLRSVSNAAGMVSMWKYCNWVHGMYGLSMVG